MSLDRQAHVAEWIEFSSGLALLYMGPEGAPDEYTERLMAAHGAEDLDEMDHVTALMLALMRIPQDKAPEWVTDRWVALDRAYHARFCACDVA